MNHWQTWICFLIVAGAAFYVLRHYYRRIKSFISQGKKKPVTISIKKIKRVKKKSSL